MEIRVRYTSRGFSFVSFVSSFLSSPVSFPVFFSAGLSFSFWSVAAKRGNELKRGSIGRGEEEMRVLTKQRGRSVNRCFKRDLLESELEMKEGRWRHATTLWLQNNIARASRRRWK